MTVRIWWHFGVCIDKHFWKVGYSFAKCKKHFGVLMVRAATQSFTYIKAETVSVSVWKTPKS